MRIGLGERPLKRRLDERPLFAGMFGALFAAAMWFPFHRNPYVCTFKQITGHPCFTCGMTRSWVLQIHGRLADGLIQSPLGSLLFFLALGFTVWTIVRLAFRLPELRFDLGRHGSALLWGAGVAAFMGNWLYSILTGVA